MAHSPVGITIAPGIRHDLHRFATSIIRNVDHIKRNLPIFKTNGKWFLKEDPSGFSFVNGNCLVSLGKTETLEVSPMFDREMIIGLQITWGQTTDGVFNLVVGSLPEHLEVEIIHSDHTDDWPSLNLTELAFALQLLSAEVTY